MSPRNRVSTLEIHQNFLFVLLQQGLQHHAFVALILRSHCMSCLYCNSFKGHAAYDFQQELAYGPPDWVPGHVVVPLEEFGQAVLCQVLLSCRETQEQNLMVSTYRKTRGSKSQAIEEQLKPAQHADYTYDSCTRTGLR